MASTSNSIGKRKIIERIQQFFIDDTGSCFCIVLFSVDIYIFLKQITAGFSLLCYKDLLHPKAFKQICYVDPYFTLTETVFPFNQKWRIA